MVERLSEKVITCFLLMALDWENEYNQAVEMGSAYETSNHHWKVV